MTNRVRRTVVTVVLALVWTAVPGGQTKPVNVVFENFTSVTVNVLTFPSLDPECRVRSSFSEFSVPPSPQGGPSVSVTRGAASPLCYQFSYSNPKTVIGGQGRALPGSTVSIKAFSLAQLPAPPVRASQAGSCPSCEAPPIEILPASIPGAFGNVDGEWTRYVRQFAKWRDFTAPPQTRTTCTREWWGDWPWPATGQWRTCVEWQLDCKWTDHVALLEVTGKAIDRQTFDTTIEQCVQRDADVVLQIGLAADELLSGGQPQWTHVLEQTLDVCLKAISGNPSLSARIRRTKELQPQWNRCPA